MASLRNRNGTYYAQFSDAARSPQTKRFSLRTSRKNVARRLLASFEERYEKRDFDPWQDDPFPPPAKSVDKTTGEGVDLFLAAKEKAGLKENSIRTYEEVLSLMRAHVGAKKPMRRLTAKDLHFFIHAEALAPASREKHYNHVRAFLRWAEREGLIDASPLAGVTKPPKAKRIPKAIRIDQLEALCIALIVDYTNKLDAGAVEEGQMVWRVPMFLFGFYTGMRASELARLRWGHLDFDRALIYIFEQKNKEEETIPLNTKAREVIGGLTRSDDEHFVFLAPGSDPIERDVKAFVNNSSSAFREAKRLAEIGGRLSLHSLRHGFCTALAEAGKSAFVIREAARHADIQTSAIYVSVANEALKAEIEDAFG